MSITLSSELQHPKCMPDAYNVMIDFGTMLLGTYATGGVDATSLRALFRYCLLVNVVSKDGYTFEYDNTEGSEKIKVFLAGLEVANDSDLDTLLESVQYFAIGFRT